MLDLALLQRGGHTRGSRRLDSIDLDTRPQRLQRKSHTCDETAAADRHDHGLDIGHVLENLQADCALAGYNQRIVKRMHERVAVLLLQLKGFLVGIVVDTRH